jgi:OmpA-OmpF porin, OOP family
MTTTQTTKIVAGLMGGAALMLSGAAFAQQPDDWSSYWRNSQDPQVWKNSYGQCWRAGYWTPATANCACDKDILPKEKCEPPAPPPPAPAAAPPPPPPPPAPKLAPEKVSFSADVLFDFDKAVLKPAGKDALSAFADKLKGVNYEVIVSVGHTDRIGSDAYNKKLSVRRAEAVKEFLVKEKGIPANKVYTDGKGKADPVTKPGQCKGNKANKALIECLQPDRRVDVEVAGTRETK